MSFHAVITAALRRAGVAFTDDGNGCLDIGPGVSVWTGSRTVVWSVRVSESATHRKTSYTSHRFTGRRWVRRLVRAVVEGVCPVCGLGRDDGAG
jgi:hypothetical protein